MRFFYSFLAVLLMSSAALAADPDPSWAFHMDETLIGQRHGSFSSTRPDGPNSMNSAAERSYSSVTGVNLGYDLGQGTEAWMRVETIRGIPLSNAGGLAALTNNDMQRIMENRFTSYIALGYVTHTWNLGGNAQAIEADSHQFARESTERRISLTLGKLDALDIFDNNAYAHKSDDQFLNW
ncbi:MAG: hypothetical protein G3I10_09560, partial [Ferrovum sp.]|nr:hypothetical protein [Ferrovum sp.]